MYRKMLKSKIHRAVVTGSSLNYIGSITIDKDLLDQAGIKEYELVQVVNINNGARLETYAVKGAEGSGVIEMNGAASRMAEIGDRIIIMTYAYVEEPLPDQWQPCILLVNDQNQVEKILC